MKHRFQCQCGAIAGELLRAQRAVRAVCYCRDCQAYARVLGQPERVLDPLGGTDVVATHASYVRFTAGAQSLACLSLSPRGLLRWYAGCCRTPIANTPRDWKLPYVGLVHTCLHQPDPMERSFPRVQLRVNTGSAHGSPPRDNSVGGMAGFTALVLQLGVSRLFGNYRDTPFFDAEGTPLAEPGIVPRAEVEAARRAAP